MSGVWDHQFEYAFADKDLKLSQLDQQNFCYGKNVFVFIRKFICQFFHTDTAYKFWKDVNGIIHGKDDYSFNQARVISVTKVSVQQAKDFHGFNGLFVVSCEWNFFL